MTNAICHRDYYDTGANIMVELYDDRLVFTNPGGLLPIVAKDFGHMSKSRNPKIFELFTRMDLVEKVGSGIPRIAAEMKAAGLPAPEYKTDGFFATILYKAIKVSPENDNDREKTTLSKRQLSIISLMKENKQITTKELKSRLHISITTVNREIKELKKKEFITRKGGDKGGEWMILQ